MPTPKVPSNTGGAKIDRQGHTTNGMHGDIPRAKDSKRGTASDEKIKSNRS